MPSPVKVGLVGFGISAKVFHAPFLEILDEYQLVSVVERNRSDSKGLYPEVNIVRRVEELIADPDIELIVITTPNETHFPYAKLGLENGKHVVVEKPFTNTSAEGLELIEIAKNSGRILSVYQNRRYVSDFLTIEKLIRENAFGEVHEFVAHYDRYRMEARPQAWREKPKPGSGILFDLGPHLIDQVLYLFGIPDEITADIRLQRPHAQVDDYFEIWLHYPDIKVTLHAGMLIREPGPRYMIHGTQGSYVKSGEDPQEAALRAGIKPISDDWGKEDPEIYGILHTQSNGEVTRKAIPSLPGDYGQYYRNLYDSIRSGAPVKELPEHGYNTIRIIELAFLSAKKKRTINCSELIDIGYA